MTVKMVDVANAAGVSIKTVSNALNGYPYMKPDTRERVLEAARALNFVRNESARALRSGKSKVIGLVIPDLRNAYFAELVDAVMTAAERRDYTVILHQTKGDRTRELASLQRGILGPIDGLLFTALALGDRDADILRSEVPIVLLGDHLLTLPADHVTMENVKAARAMTEHLLDIGRRRIVVVGAHRGEIIGSAGLRVQGYREALDEAGVPFDESLIGYIDRWHRSDGATVMKSLLSDGVEFDAVFGLNDMLALGAMRALLAHGIRVPEEVAVGGFDDLEEASYSLPTLTSIAPGLDQIAEESVDRLVSRIDGRSSGPERTYSTFELKIRESTVADPGGSGSTR